MGLIKSCRRLLVKFDFFPATQFLRYKGSTEYRTATGGVFTILIIVIFCLLFFQALTDIIARRNVTVKSNIEHQATPGESSISFGPEGGFLFAVKINGMNLSQTGKKYFDVTLQQNQFVPILQLNKSKEIPLTMCTKEHFNFNRDILSAYYTFNGSGLLCPPTNISLNIKGKVTSDIYKRLTISVKKCNSSLKPNCASDGEVEALQNTLGYFGLTVLLVNTQLNPSMSTGYKQYYLQEKNFFPFTTSLAVRGNAGVQSYKIKTDYSIIPISQNILEGGVRVPDLFQYSMIPVLSNTYALIHLQKSSKFQSYSRTFTKLDTLFAYVGGLIGTILGLIFILDSYNELCYELSLSSRIFTYQEGEEIQADKFNFILYLIYLLNKIFHRLVCCKGFRMMRVITECQQEIEKQLDVALILKKIIFFQRAISKLSIQTGINTKSCYNKRTLDEAKVCRLNYEVQESTQEKDTDEKVQETPGIKEQDKDSMQPNRPIISPLLLEAQYRSGFKEIQMGYRISDRFPSAFQHPQAILESQANHYIQSNTSQSKRPQAPQQYYHRSPHFN